MTDFLYPFLDREERDVGPLMDDLARSAEAKASLSEALRTATLATLAGDLDDAAAAMAARFGRGGRLFAFGNGGSSTDAAGVAALFCHPPEGRSLPARSLVADHAILTALANDVGYELVFSRQLIATAGPEDIALGLSTSGSSPNLLRAFAEARRLGLLTIGLAGYDGGTMAAADTVDHCLIVRSDSVHRIQEVQSAVVFALWQRVERAVDEKSVGAR
ncbi:MAG: putative sedoheptulose 7-phosphate isomerase [Acidimicrobiales bacterium]|nr:putative sedoheptulose 7-phosphate isomerase [Acidimicrobiales bacterium]